MSKMTKQEQDIYIGRIAAEVADIAAYAINRLCVMSFPFATSEDNLDRYTYPRQAVLESVVKNLQGRI